jgi:uncharacterized protein YdeI (YjbR/CyaY-like superfamily)
MSMAAATNIDGGVVHDLPPDLEAMLAKSPGALATWRDITPLARNEWICWVISSKKAETRASVSLGGVRALQKGRGARAAGLGAPIADF